MTVRDQWLHQVAFLKENGIEGTVPCPLDDVQKTDFLCELLVQAARASGLQLFVPWQAKDGRLDTAVLPVLRRVMRAADNSGAANPNFGRFYFINDHDHSKTFAWLNDSPFWAVLRQKGVLQGALAKELDKTLYVKDALWGLHCQALFAHPETTAYVLEKFVLRDRELASVANVNPLFNGDRTVAPPPTLGVNGRRL